MSGWAQRRVGRRRPRQLWAATAPALIAAGFLAPTGLRAPVALLFAAPGGQRLAAARRGAAGQATGTGSPLCGRAPPAATPPEAAGRRRLPAALAATAVAAPLSWMDPRRWVGPPPASHERLSPREWTRMYRTLGIPEDSSKEQVLKAATRLRKKYAEDDEALDRVERANLWIMTRMVARSEEATRARQQANRMRELGDSPRRLFQKYVAGHLPPSVRQMFELPDTKHFRWSSALLGGFALLALCVPTQAANFVGLGGVSALGLVYQRNRPEPVKDEFGNVGRVTKINPKEMVASIVLVLIGVLIGVGVSFALDFFLEVAFQMTFAPTTCLVLWLVALFFKVHQCFDP